MSSGLDLQRLRIGMELNSLEAIKNAVQSGLGAAFLPIVSIERELTSGTIHKAPIIDLVVKRDLKLISNPSRYSSKAAKAFRRDVLPMFAKIDSPLKIEQETDSKKQNSIKIERHTICTTRIEAPDLYFQHEF